MGKLCQDQSCGAALRMTEEREVDSLTGEAKFFEMAELKNQREQAGKSYREFLRAPAMSAGVYTLPAGGSDPQKPHRQEEMYYVVSGRARMRVGSEDRAINQGSVIFVAANVE